MGSEAIGGQSIVARQTSLLQLQQQCTAKEAELSAAGKQFDRNRDCPELVKAENQINKTIEQGFRSMGRY